MQPYYAPKWFWPKLFLENVFHVKHFHIKETPFYTGQFVYAVAIPAISHHQFNNLLNLRKNETIFITWNVKTKEIK